MEDKGAGPILCTATLMFLELHTGWHVNPVTGPDLPLLDPHKNLQHCMSSLVSFIFRWKLSVLYLCIPSFRLTLPAEIVSIPFSPHIYYILLPSYFIPFPTIFSSPPVLTLWAACSLLPSHATAFGAVPPGVLDLQWWKEKDVSLGAATLLGQDTRVRV